MLRTFIAARIDPAPGLKRLIGRLADLEGLRPVSTDSLHVTLKFVGDTPDQDVAGVCRAIESCVACEKPFIIRLKGVGAFPTAERPSVLWVGIDQREPLVRIAERLETAIVGLGFPAEPRAFTPHLTLLRFKHRPPEAVFRMLRDEGQSDFGSVRIDSVICYQSELGRGGPEYTPLATVKLKP